MTNDPDLHSPARPGGPETKAVASSISSETSSAPVSGPLSPSDAPRVDEAMNSVLEHRNAPYVEPKETLSALREEVDSVRYRASDRLRSTVRKNPWHAVGIAAFAGFLFGITR
jgi:hypothetical protein